MASRLGPALLVTLGVPLAVLLSLDGCSDDEAPTAGDAATDARDAGPRRDAPPEGVTDATSCTAACDESHPAGVAKDRAIVACWETSCKGPCIDGRGSPDAGDGGARSCGATPVVTVNESC